MRLNKINLFPTSVFYCENLLQKKEMENIKKSLKKHDRVNYYQTEADLHTKKPFAFLVDDIERLARSIFDDKFYHYDDFEITGMWANECKKDMFLAPHAHANNFFAGVYYLEAPQGSSPLVFMDPRPQAHLIKPYKTKLTVENTMTWTIPPRSNTIYLFPAWLQHYVEAQGINKKRTSISFNIMFKGDVGPNGSEKNEF